MIRVLVALLLSIFTWQVMAFKSSIDDGGYFYIDSSEGDFSYEFEDLTVNSSSNIIPLADDDHKSVGIGFPFEFYGISFDSVYVTSKAVLSFTVNGHSYDPVGIPSVDGFSRTGTSILGWWGDLDPSITGDVRSIVKGAAPNRVFIVQFTDTQLYGGGGNNTLQFKLFETSNEIEVHYKNLYNDSGESYAVGIQKDATIGHQVWFGTGNNNQDNPAPFSTPHAIKYINQSSIAPTVNSEKMIVRSGLGIANNRSLELESTFNSAIDVELEYLTTEGLSATVNGPTSITINANSTLTTPFDVTILEGNDLKDNKVLIRVKSTDNLFATFDIAVQLVIVETTQFTMNEFASSYQAKRSYDGNKVIFLSNDALTAEPKSPGTVDLYVYDVNNNAYQQLTNISNLDQCHAITISGDGKWAAAVCDVDIDPSRSNADNSKEVFLFDLENDSVKQIATDMNATTDLNSLALDYTGETLLFISNTDLAGINNAGNYEIFSYLKSADIFIQVSDFNAGVNVYGLDLDYRGERFVTSAMSNVFGINPNLKFQVFTGSTKTGILKQVTMDENFDSGFAKISANGEYLTFSSYAPLVAGGASGTGNVFIANFESASIDQITNSSTLDSGYSDISADGARVVFASRESLNGDNLSSNAEVFLFSRLTSTISQLTEVNDTEGVVGLSYSENGSVISFSGTADWQVGSNTAGNPQVFTLSGLFESSVTPAVKSLSRKDGVGTTRTTTITTEETAGAIPAVWIWLFAMLAVVVRIRAIEK
jgi:hypothetical protein